MRPEIRVLEREFLFLVFVTGGFEKSPLLFKN
jgi:hypothetical protein